MSDLGTPPALNQILLRKWAYYGSTHLGNDLFYLLEFIELSIQEIGELHIVKMLIEDTGRNKERLNLLGKNWVRFRNRLGSLSEKVAGAKVLYDCIENKAFSKIDEKGVLGYLKYVRRLNLIQEDVYALAIFLMNHSSIRGLTIKSEDWKVLENTSLKKLDVTARKPVYDSEVNK